MDCCIVIKLLDCIIILLFKSCYISSTCIFPSIVCFMNHYCYYIGNVNRQFKYIENGKKNKKRLFEINTFFRKPTSYLKLNDNNEYIIKGDFRKSFGLPIILNDNLNGKYQIDYFNINLSIQRDCNIKSISKL